MGNIVIILFFFIFFLGVEPGHLAIESSFSSIYSIVKSQIGSKGEVYLLPSECFTINLLIFIVSWINLGLHNLFLV